jgi:Ca2+-binding RTX toxin-like protein
MKRRNNRSKLNYQSLETRRVLASLVNFDSATGTLYIRAEAQASTPFVSEIAATEDVASSELVVSEAGEADQRFPLADVTHISYQGTTGDDHFVNDSEITSRIIGFAGNDVLLGGRSADRINGGNGEDHLTGGFGDDHITGGNGNDTLIENTATDGGNDKMFGGEGDDDIFAGNGADLVVAGDGGDTVNSGEGSDIVLLGDGNDSATTLGGNDIVYGGDGLDNISGGNGADRLFGQGGNDDIFGGAHGDYLRGGDGNDNIKGDNGNDRIFGDLGNDILFGNGGKDTIFAAVPTTLDLNLGLDIADGGDDDFPDTIVKYSTDTGINRSKDSFVDVSVARANGQRAFLVSNKDADGWIETESGLQIRMLVNGTGASPTASDFVRVNYVGTYIDGLQFDAGGPVEFPLFGVIAGWTEALQLMKEGGTAELAIPSELAYGESGVGSIPGDTTLLFTVDLLAVL